MTESRKNELREWASNSHNLKPIERQIFESKLTSEEWIFVFDVQCERIGDTIKKLKERLKCL